MVTQNTGKKKKKRSWSHPASLFYFNKSAHFGNKYCVCSILGHIVNIYNVPICYMNHTAPKKKKGKW